jgi:hypothetical protein
MGAVVTSLTSKVYRLVVPMIREEELEALARNDFIVGKTVDEAREEYPDIVVRVVGRRLANGEDTDIVALLDYYSHRVDVRVDDSGVIVELLGTG